MEASQKIKQICPTTALERVKNGALIVDVREQDEVNLLSFDVPYIINIPLSEFDLRFQEIPKDKNVVTVCKGGGRSLRAAGFLINHGFEHVENMQNGIVKWVEKGFPTKGNATDILSNGGTDCCSTSGCC